MKREKGKFAARDKFAAQDRERDSLREINSPAVR